MRRASAPHVLRLCSVFEAPAAALRATGFDPIGGMQIHTARLARALDALGVSQTVVTAFRPGAPRTETIGTRSAVVRVGLPIRRLRQLYGLAAVPEVGRVRPDLVHAHLGEDLAIAPLARWAAARSGAPLVVTLHCSVRHTVSAHDLRSALLRTLGARLEGWLLGAASQILVLSDATADALLATGIPRKRILPAPIGVDLDRFARPAPRPASMDPAHRWIVYVGRLVPEKGVADLVQAVARLRCSQARLAVVGDGPHRRVLQHLVEREGLGDRVTLEGAVAHHEVPGFLQHADVAVLPSWYEERGRAVLEAMAAGATVVATATGGIPDSVRHGVNGLLVPPRDPDALAGAIDRVLFDRAGAAAMARAARATAAANGVDGLTAATLHAYAAALGSDALAASPTGGVRSSVGSRRLP
jgi:glycogen(starch) synthase